MSPAPVPVERIERAIHFLRGHKVVLDSDLAALYGVETRVLGAAVAVPHDVVTWLHPRT